MGRNNTYNLEYIPNCTTDQQKGYYITLGWKSIMTPSVFSLSLASSLASLKTEMNQLYMEMLMPGPCRHLLLGSKSS